MKIFDKIVLVMYSYIILVIASIVSLLIMGWLDRELVEKVLNFMIYQDIPSKIILIINIIFIVCSVKCIFFSADTSNKAIVEKQGIVMQNQNGKLLISKETIENLASFVAKNTQNIDDVNTKITVDENNNIFVLLNLVIKSETEIKDLTVKLQDKIKETIKRTLDLDVKEVNVRVKNLNTKNEINNKNSK